MREQIFTTEVMRSLFKAKAYAHKIPDFPFSALKELKGSKIKFIPVKPFDIFGGHRGIFFAIETKQLKEERSLRPSDMRESQIIALDDLTECGNQGYVFVNLRVKFINTCYVLDWREYGEKIKTKGMTIEEMEDATRFSVVKPYTKDGTQYWDLRDFFSYVEMEYERNA